MENRAALGREAVRALPDTVVVLGHEIGIVVRSLHAAAGRATWGEFEPASQSIVLQEEYPSAHKAMETLLHEIGHAIWWAMGLQDADNEERVVRAFGTALASVFRDNLWLSEWLSEWSGPVVRDA
jgi:hypothetical protein